MTTVIAAIAKKAFNLIEASTTADDRVTLTLHRKTKVAILIVFGDSDTDGRFDADVQVFVPPAKSSGPAVHLGPFNAPVEEVLTIASGMCAMLPVPASILAQGALGFVRGVVRLAAK